MKVVVAPDSFKGSLSATEAAMQMKKAITSIMPEAEVILKPMADGGEGTLESLTVNEESKEVYVSLTGPLGTQISTSYQIVSGKTAVIEIAMIAGLTQVPESKRNPDVTTSYGVGEAVLHAMDKGCDTITIGLGGSATNDGGHGMLQALGMKSFSENGQPVGIYGYDLLHMSHIDLSGLDPRLTHINLNIASDVNNPLCGKSGASAIYGPQKGATPKQVARYDAALHTYSGQIEDALGKTFKDKEGAGAAGGLGFALLALGAEIHEGAKLIAETIHLEDAIKSADLVMTGEGQSDEQTLYGKAPGHVASIAAKHNVPILLLSGSISGGETKLREHFTGCFSILNQPMTLEACMEQADTLILEQTKQLIHFFKNISPQ